jgi:hypothetical protein
LAQAASDLLTDAGRRERLAAAGAERAAEFDWGRVARQVMAVYETVAAQGEKVLEDDRQGPGMFAGRLGWRPGADPGGPADQVTSAGSADGAASGDEGSST